MEKLVAAASPLATNWPWQQQLPMVNWNSNRAWNLTEEAGRASLASLLDWARYPSDSAAAHLLHYDSVVRPHLGPPPDNNNAPVFKSYMTDDHTPVEFSLCWRESEGKMMAPQVRYCMEPLGSSATELRSDPVGSNLLAAASLLEATCGQDGQDHITRLLWSDKMISHGQHRRRQRPQDEEEEDERATMNSQTFLAWELGRHLKDGGRPSRIAKAYSVPFVRSRELRIPGITLLERMVVGTPYAAPLATIVSYMATLPAHLRPSLMFVASDVLPAASHKLNRLKAYFRLRSSHFPHILQVLGLGREVAARQAQVYADLWESTTGSPPPNNTWNAPAQDRDPIVYFDLAPASADDVEGSMMTRSSKLYIPVKYLASHDDVVARGLERFLERRGYQGWQGYRDAVARTFAHRPLAARAGVHTYVSCHFNKPGAAMPEITSYLSPEVYAPERHH